MRKWQEVDIKSAMHPVATWPNRFQIFTDKIETLRKNLLSCKENPEVLVAELYDDNWVLVDRLDWVLGTLVCGLSNPLLGKPLLQTMLLGQVLHPELHALVDLKAKVEPAS